MDLLVWVILIVFALAAVRVLAPLVIIALILAALTGRC